MWRPEVNVECILQSLFISLSLLFLGEMGQTVLEGKPGKQITFEIQRKTISNKYKNKRKKREGYRRQTEYMAYESRKGNVREGKTEE